MTTPGSFFNRAFQRKNPVIEMVKMSGGRLPIRYHCRMDKSPYSFQDIKFLFYD